MWWWPDKSGTRELPYVYEHSITIAAPRSRVGSALQRYTAISLRIPEGSPIARVPGTQPRAGFEVRTARRPIA
jgi:hypothetical protein